MTRLLTLMLAGSLVVTGVQAQGLKVPTRKPGKGELVRTLKVKGDIYAYARGTLKARVTGILESLAFEEGDTIKGQGKVVATLAVPDLVSELAQAKADTAAAQASIEEASKNLEVTRDQIQLLEADVKVARSMEGVATAALNLKKVVFERLKKLLPERAATPAKVEDAQAEVVMGEAKLAGAVAQTAKAAAALSAAASRVDAAAARVRSAESRHEAAQSRERLIKTRIAFASVGNPFEESTVLRRLAEPGDVIEADTTPILEVQDSRRVRIRFDLSERDALRLPIGTEVLFRTDTEPDRPFTAKVQRLASALTMATRTRWAETIVPNESGRFLPGGYVFVTVTFRTGTDAVLLPARYVIRGRGNPHVLVAQSGKVVKRSVVLGLLGARRADLEEGRKTGSSVDPLSHLEILRGLDGTEQVITGSLAGLREGDAVSPMPLEGGP